MGWSCGTMIMGAYTADHNDKVDRLVLYAPVWLRTSSPPQTAPPPLGAYVAAPMATARQRLQDGAPDSVGAKQSRRCCAAQRACSRTTAITGMRASHTTIPRGSRFQRL